MAFSKTTIKTLIKTRLKSISNEVTTSFKQGNHITEDAVNDKIAQAIAAAFEQFITDAIVHIDPQNLVSPPHAALVAAGTPLLALLPYHHIQGSSPNVRFSPQ